VNKATIIIPHRGNPLGLWATIHSCESDLLRERDVKIEWNYVLVTNGEKLPVEAVATIEQLKMTGRLLGHIHSPEPLTPPVARSKGAAIADGELLFFFDNHCLVEPRYFARAFTDYERYRYGMLHSTTIFHSGDGPHYHYQLRLEQNFWGGTTHFCESDILPYKIACGGHGGIVVPKNVWNEVGGYGPDYLFRGYGGEETIFDLKLWLYGYDVMIDPRMIHYHYAGVRGYARHYTDDYYINLMVSANVIGGEKWLYKVFNSFVDTTKNNLRVTGSRDWYDLLIEAYERSAQYAAEVRARSKYRSLDELLEMFRSNCIPM
jgi:hypothetical protein